MSYCDEFVELVSAAVDGALSDTERTRLEEHLEQCPQCRALYEDLLSLHAALSDLPPVEVPEDLTDRIMAAVAADNVVPLVPPVKKRSNPWQKWLASAAVLAVVIAGAWELQPWKGVQNATGGASAQAAPQATIETRVEDLPEAAANYDDSAVFAGETVQAKMAPAAEPQAEDGPLMEEVLEEPPQETEDLPAAHNFSAGEQSPRLRSAPVPAEGDPISEGQEPLAPEASEAVPETAAIQPFMAMAPVPSEEPAETAPAETEAPEVVPNSLLLTASLPEALPVDSPRAALERLLAEYPMPDCETWEYEDLEPGWTSPVWNTLSDTGESLNWWLLYEGTYEYESQTYYHFNTFVSDDPQGEGSYSPVGYGVPADGGEILVAGN